jgi:hypothetical protein
MTLICCKTSSAVFRNSGFGATGACEDGDFGGSDSGGEADCGAAAATPTASTNSKLTHRFIPASRKYRRKKDNRFG